MESTEQQEGKITLADIEKCVLRYGGQRTSAMLSILERNRPVYQILKSDIGQVFFKEAINRIESLFLKIMEDEATKEERVEYKIMRRLLISWGKKLAVYENLKTKVTNNVKESQDA